MEIVCPRCKNPVTDTDFFCHTCGKKLKDPPISTSFGKQLGIYIIAVLFPPFGLIPAFKYLKVDTRKAKMVGLVTILLTVVTITVSVLLTLQVISEANKIISSQMQGLQNLNY